MNDLLGILIPLLMSGADMQTIFRHLAGSNGAASYDGLRGMMSRRNMSFATNNPLRPSAELIERNASAFVDTIGVNPYTGVGQGLTKMIGSMYGFAPDIVGSFIGLPNSGAFYQQVANGASGISVASGQGLPSLFNPYSARDAYNNAVNLSRTIHNFATTQGHGFNVDFTHGLNMSEVGTVAERMLSSNIPYIRYARGADGSIDYASPTGQRLDRASEEFSENLKNLGSKFNETVSMLSKITGSVKEAIDLMDRIGGGNFLGGTADEALAVARRAQNMAANIRVTSAMAGIDPKEAYANMLGTQQGLVSRYGLNPMLAAASGLDSMMLDPAYKATMAYQEWAALNPGAPERVKMQVMAGARARVMQYAGTSGEALAAMVSANRDKFSQDDINAIKAAFRMGRPNDIVNMVRDRIGARSYEDYMSDPAAIMGFRLTGDKGLQSEFMDAGVEGNLMQAQLAGGRRRLMNNLADTDRMLEMATGDTRYRGVDRRNAVEAALRRMAVRNGMTEELAGKSSLMQLRSYLLENGVDGRIVERTEHTAEIEAQLGEIQSLTMTPEEEIAAKTRLKDLVSKSGIYQGAKLVEVMNAIDAEGSNLNAIYSKVIRAGAAQGMTFDKGVLGGKLSAAEAASARGKLEADRGNWTVANSPEEMRRAMDAVAGRLSLKGSAGLLGVISSKDFANAESDVKALMMYRKKAFELQEEGRISLGEDPNQNINLQNIFGEASKNMVAGLLGSRIGNLESGTAGYDKLVDELSSRMLTLAVRGNMSLDAAFLAAAEQMDLKKSGLGAAIGEKGLEQFDKWKNDPNLLKDVVNRANLAASATTIINRGSSKSMVDASKGLFNALGSDASDAGEKFYEAAKRLSAAGALDRGAFDSLDRNALGTKEGRMSALEKMAPDAYNKRLDPELAALGTGDVQTSALAFIATMAEKDGLSMDFNTLKSMLPEYSDDQIAGLVSYFDKLAARRGQNALSNAINLGSGSFGREEIERSRKMIGDLREKMKAVGIDVSELEKYGAAGAEEKKNIIKGWSKKLGDATYNVAVTDSEGKVKVETRKVFDDSDYAAKFLASMSEERSIGGVSVSKLLSDKSVDLKGLDVESLGGVTKKAYQKDSTVYEISNGISQIVEKLGGAINVFVTGYGESAVGQKMSAVAAGAEKATPSL